MVGAGQRGLISYEDEAPVDTFRKNRSDAPGAEAVILRITDEGYVGLERPCGLSNRGAGGLPARSSEKSVRMRNAFSESGKSLTSASLGAAKPAATATATNAPHRIGTPSRLTIKISGPPIGGSAASPR